MLVNKWDSVNSWQSAAIAADAGSFSVTGTDATLSATNAYEIVADAGSFTVAGTAATLTNSAVTGEIASAWFNGTWWKSPFWGANFWGTGAVNYEIVSDAGSFTITGSDATLSKTGDLVADAGSFSVTGSDAQLYISPVFEAGSFVITGTDMSGNYGYSIAADSGERIRITGRRTILNGKGGVVPCFKMLSQIISRSGL